MSASKPAPKGSRAERIFGPWTIFVIFFGAGTSHLLTPKLWEPAVPPQLPNAKLMVYLSGVAEIIGALLFINKGTRKLGGDYLFALLIAVFPANIYMWTSEKWHARVPGGQTALLLRLPIQFLGMWWVRELAKRTTGTAPAAAPAPTDTK